MKKTKILTIVICFLVAVASFGFVACDSPNDGTKHNFDSAWTYNETEHWHKCTDKDCTEISNKANHTFVDGICSICQAKKPEELSTADLFVNLEKSLVALNNSEGFNITIGGKEASVCAPIEFENRSIPAKIIVDADLELFVGKDADGKPAVNGFGKFVIDVDKNTTEDQFKDLSNDFFCVNFEAAVIFKGETAYIQANGKGEAKDNFFADMNNTGEYSRSVTVSEVIQQIKDAISHIKGGYFEAEESDQMPDSSVMSIISLAVKEILPSVIEELNTALTPVINGIYAKRETAISNYVDLNLKNMFTVDKTDNGYTLKRNFNNMKQQAEDMVNLTVAAYIDKYWGEGTVDNVSNALKALLDTKISEVLTYTETFLGITVDDIVAEINKIIAIVLQNETIAAMLPEGTTASDYTIEKLLSLPDGMTVKPFLLTMAGDQTVCDLITIISGLTKTDINGYIDETVKYAKENTYLDILSVLVSSSSGTKIDFTAHKDTILKTTNDMIDIIAEMFSYELEIGKNGSFNSLSAKLKFNDTILSKISENDGFAEIAKALNGVSADVTVNVSITKGEFKNALNIDYEKIITSVIESEKAAA